MAAITCSSAGARPSHGPAPGAAAGAETAAASALQVLDEGTAAAPPAPAAGCGRRASSFWHSASLPCRGRASLTSPLPTRSTTAFPASMRRDVAASVPPSGSVTVRPLLERVTTAYTAFPAGPVRNRTPSGGRPAPAQGCSCAYRQEAPFSQYPAAWNLHSGAGIGPTPAESNKVQKL
eukprot:TRINITY_DN10453_c0_g1_i1.p1 TRINITY_DN10453_c0_g1~~TRINITY_DN10453_c0_g1_i1.p1  ORF type:complete len:178 (-),score=16.05 TRINITY_DN10453_c0_g1_i1:1-534(-)